MLATVFQSSELALLFSYLSSASLLKSSSGYVMQGKKKLMSSSGYVVKQKQKKRSSFKLWLKKGKCLEFLACFPKERTGIFQVKH